MKNHQLLLCLTFAAALAAQTLVSTAAPAHGAAPVEINDQEIINRLSEKGEELQASGKTVAMSNLVAQISRRKVTPGAFKMPPPPAHKVSSTELAAVQRNGVVVVGGLYKCTKCPRWHVQPATGFIISEAGIVATCYHVVNKPEHSTLLAQTADGVVHAVKEILAANEQTDLAILQLEPGNYSALSLSTEAPAGSPVRVISHPSSHFYMLSEGIVSRYANARIKSEPVTMMSITADFARGSSGGPVFNENGAVVGMVRATQSIYYTEEAGKKDNLQMVFKLCVPTKHLLDLLQ